MMVAIWAVFSLLAICNAFTLPLPDSISNPPASNSTDLFPPIPSNLSLIGHNKDRFAVPDTNLKGVVAWPMPRITFTKIVVEACINFVIQNLRKWPGTATILVPDTSECEPLIITLWPLVKHGTAPSITYSEGIAVFTALNIFIADSTSYGNIYVYVFRGADCIATINMQQMIAPNLITSDNVTTSDTEVNPYNISTIPSNFDDFIVPNTSPILKGILAWPEPRSILEKDPVTALVRAFAARMKAMPIGDIVPGPKIEYEDPLMLTLYPLHNTAYAPFMTYWEAASILTFFNQYMAHSGSYANFYVYIFRGNDCIATLNLAINPTSSSTNSDNNQLSVT